MKNQQENAATTGPSRMASAHTAPAPTAPQVEKQPANVEVEGNQANASQAPARDADVIKDEQEATRRAKLPKSSEESPEAENPQVAEIESMMAAFRH